MTKKKTRLFLIVALSLMALLVSLIRNKAAEDQLYESTIYTFGTLVKVSIWSSREAEVREALNELERSLNTMNDQWHAWRPSVLTQTNAQLQAGQPFEPDAGIQALIAESKVLYTMSGGLFNPAIGDLINAWGFHSSDPNQTRRPPPDDWLQQQVLNLPTMDDIEMVDGQLLGKNPRINLDFGGFAKGFGVDRAIEQLQARGIQNAIVNAGGDLRAVGQRGSRPWRVAIQDPFNKEDALAILEVGQDTSVFTSGAYERVFWFKNRQYHHIIDPRTGYPAVGLVMVTVVHDNATVADAAATALMVAGPDEVFKIAEKMGIRAVLVMTDDHEIRMTPEMESYVQVVSERYPMHMTE